MKRFQFLPLAMLVLLAAPHYASAGPVYVGSVPDALGDTFGGGPDVTFAGIVVDDSWVTFTMQFAPGMLDPATTRSSFSIDADQNSATGDFWNGLGIEFLVGQGNLGNTGTASLSQFPGNLLLASVPVTYLGDRVEYSFARALFGAEDGLFDFIAAVQVSVAANASNPIHDFAPNIERQAGPASTASVPEPATFGMLAGGLLLSAYRQRGTRRNPRG
jgi:hypothetical protein